MNVTMATTFKRKNELFFPFLKIFQFVQFVRISLKYIYSSSINLCKKKNWMKNSLYFSICCTVDTLVLIKIWKSRFEIRKARQIEETMKIWNKIDDSNLTYGWLKSGYSGNLLS